MTQDDNNGASGAVDEQTESVDHTEESHDDGTSGSDKRGVSHSTYKKTVSEAKAMRERARAAEEKLKSLEEQRLADQGNKDELIKSLRSKLDVETKRTKEIYGGFARRSLSQQLKAEAASAGCVDADAVMSLADLSALDVDPETFEADADQVREVINDLKKSKPYLFQKAGPKVNGKMPSGERARGFTQEDLMKQSSDDLMGLLRKMK